MENLNVVTPNSALKSFFNAFDYKLITVSVQPEGEGAFRPNGNYFNAVNGVRAVPPETFFSEEFQKELRFCQAHKCAVYFLINEGNGLPSPDASPGNLNCGKKANITELKALFIDVDNDVYDALCKKLIEYTLRPHFILESSPKKYHFYFLIKPLPAVGDNISKWEALQKCLAELTPGLDKSMADINQVLRVPSFYNQKSKYPQPHQVKIVKIFDIPPYDLNLLYTALGADKYNEFQTEFDNALNGIYNYKETYNKFEFPKGFIAQGGRRTYICRFMEHLMENKYKLTDSREEYFLPIDGFINTYIHPNERHEFLEGGRYRQNLYNYLRDQIKYRERKIHAKEAYIANQQMDNIVALQDSKLPDDFYKQFPGDLGMITKEISTFAPNLPQEICFAGALAISGALKAETFRFRGAWPFVNGLVIAGTGVGKSALKDIVERALSFAGLMGAYPQVLGFDNSVQSLHTNLYSAGGAGTLLIDESGDYLQTITGKNAPAYAKALKKYFKESTTGRDEGTRLSPGGSLSFKIPPIKGGMLSLWMLIQPDKFHSSMDLADMADGFLPRFFVFNGKSKIKLTRTFEENIEQKSFTPSVDFQVYLQALVQMMPGISVKELTDATEKELKENSPKAKADVIYNAKREAVHTARSEARRIGSTRVNVTISDEARYIVQDYLKEREAEAQKIQDKDSDDPSLGVYIRIEEMLFRLLCNAATFNHIHKTAHIDQTLADGCIAFHRFQTDRFFKNELAEISKGTGERDMDSVLLGIKKAFHAKGKQPVKVGDISIAIKNTKRPKNIAFVLQELIKRGQVITQMLPNKKLANHMIPYYLPGEND